MHEKKPATPPLAGAARGGLRATVRAQAGTLLSVSVVAALVTAMVPLAVYVSDGSITVAELVSDPAEVTGQPWYLGALTSVTLLVWGGGAALYLIGGCVLRPRSAPLGAVLLWLGGLTLVLTADDLFLLHEIVIPWIVGVGELGTFAVYAVVVLAVLLRYRRTLLAQREAPVLAFALVAFAFSVGLDLLGADLNARRIAEEGLKLLGALAWAAFPAQLIVRSAAAGDTPESHS